MQLACVPAGIDSKGARHMDSKPSAAPPAAGAFSSEVLRFGTIGAIGWIVDTAVFNLCLHVLDLQTVRSGLIASAVAICVNYLGNRSWTYRNQSSDQYTGEAFRFLLFSAIGTVIQNGILAISHYGLGYTSGVADNVAKNFVGLAVATIFRFWSYRTFVFRAEPEEKKTNDQRVRS